MENSILRKSTMILSVVFIAAIVFLSNLKETYCSESLGEPTVEEFVRGLVNLKTSDDAVSKTAKDFESLWKLQVKAGENLKSELAKLARKYNEAGQKDKAQILAETTIDYSLEEIVKELVLTEVSGNTMVNVAKEFELVWKKYIKGRETLALKLAELAAKFEEAGQYDKALFLYESIWKEYPEQSEVMGKIKRDKALQEIEIDLSTPQKTFESLKRSLLIYRLTADTFGIVDPRMILYQPHTIEITELEEWRKKSEDKRERLLKEIESQQEGETEVSEEPDEENDRTTAKEGKKWVMNWPEAVEIPEHKEHSSTLGNVIIQKIESKDLILSEFLKKLSSESKIPIIISSSALAIMNEYKEKTITIKLENVPVKEILRYVLRMNDSDLVFTVRRFYIYVSKKNTDAMKEFPLITGIRQSDPWGYFTKDTKIQVEPISESIIDFLISCGMPGIPASLNEGRAERSDDLPGKLPEGWEILSGDLAIYKVPQYVFECIADMVSTAPSAGTYKGRTDPLLACMRAYPLPDKINLKEYYTIHPKKRYKYDVQVGAQTMRVQRFLCNRIAINELLHRKLLDFKSYPDGRYKPVFSDSPDGEFTLPMAIWLDGNKHRFLVFDSFDERDRWLNGENWFDIPSDYDTRKWYTDKEWQQRLKDRQMDGEK